MNTLFTSTLAIAALGTLAHATPDPNTTPVLDLTSTEGDWERLDSEISSLVSSVRRPSTGTNVGGLLRTYYKRSTKDAFELDTSPNDGFDNGVNSGQDLSTFDMKEVQLYAEGSVAEYDWRINFDYQNDTVVLEDAYGRFNYGNGFNFVIGNFKSPVLMSNRKYPETQLLADRTLVGQIFDFYNSGAMLAFDQDAVGGYIALQNGQGGTSEGMVYSGRLEYRLMGGTGRVEGAFGASDDLRATAGAMILKDTTNTVDGTAWGADANMTYGPMSLHAEAVHFEGKMLANPSGGSAGQGSSRISGNNLFGPTVIPVNYAASGGVKNALVWTTTVSYMIEAIDVEVGARFENFDDPGNTRAVTVGVNWYRSGKNVIWYAGVTQVSSNNPQGANSEVNGPGEGLGDATLLQIGLSVGLSTSSI